MPDDEDADLDDRRQATFQRLHDELRESVMRSTGLAESYARSAQEAAWRGDLIELGICLRRLRLCVIEALKAFKEIGE
jgi:hypothetical protein